MTVRLDNVVKTFATFRAVHSVSLEIPTGTLSALLGPSGSGKTTILRMVAGLEQPDGGRIFFGDRDATDIPVRERRVGFVFQHYALFPHMTVAKNIAFALKVSQHKRTKPEIADRIAELLHLVRLDDLGNRYPSQISGGQRQRVALARALAVDPEILLLDEPFGALDANVRRELRHWLREIQAHLGITTLFVTHDQEEALDLADRVVILDQGRIVQEGTPREVTRHPNSAFVTRFLGDTNVLRAKVSSGVAAVGPGVDVPADGVADGPADVFVRPSEAAWAKDAPGLPGVVARIMERPSERRLIIHVAGHDDVEITAAALDPVHEGDRGFVRILSARVFASQR